MNSLATPRALVIDDEALVAFIIEDLLRTAGYQVTVATTHQQRDEALHNGTWFALAVSDTDLASLEDMQRWNVDRIVLCSGKSVADIEAEFPGFEYICKPFADEDLLAKVRVS